MARNKSVEKKKPVRVAAGPAAPGFARSMGENTGRLLRPLLPLLVFTLVVTGISLALWYPVYGDAWGLSTSHKSAVANRGYLTVVALRQAVLSQTRPVWISREDFEQVANLGQFAAQRSLFEPNLSRELAQKYETNPWVERVQVVRLRYPAQVKLQIEWRKPAARVNQSNLVLDRHGYVLNLMCDGPAARDIPRISGLTCGRAEVGKRMPEKELLDALGLLAVIKDALVFSPGNLKVADIVREPSGMWRVVTDRGPMIYWGAFTDDPPMDEPRTREKADLLRRRLCECKDPSSLEYIKVYHASAPFKPRVASSSLNGNTATLISRR
ncbi:MAG: hypothetical protein V1899_10230 [Planctomycetota bacterium]